MTRTGRAVLAAVVVLMGTVGASLIAPHLVSLAKLRSLPPITIPGEWEGDLVPQEEHNTTTVLVRMPRRMRESDTVMVRVVLQSEPKGKVPRDVEIAYEARLGAPAFEVTPMSEPKYSVRPMWPTQLVWKWLLTPKKPGEHIVVLSFNSPVFQKGRASKIPVDAEATDSDLQVPMTVLTSFGLTTYLDGWARVLGALVAAVGTVLGYPFLKRYIEKGGDVPVSVELEN